MNDKNFRTGRHVVYDLHAHIVLTPKYRRDVFTKEVHDIVERCAREICERNNVVVQEFNTDLDHAHLIVSYPPSINLSSLIGTIKGYSSRVMRKDYCDLIKDKLWGDHFWSPSYFVSSTGGAPLEKVRKYAENQGRDPRKPGNPNFGRSADSPTP